MTAGEICCRIGVSAPSSYRWRREYGGLKVDQVRRLMELNWSLLVAKLEWNAADGEVRLSMIQNTDSNFDRRAFRGLVRRIESLADRYARELERLSAED